ncbi:MAG TPA: proline--tRNA ligase [Chloroflexota bacterium]|nr:proline--tRNA ligase [Chloroflexota bacterium]
MVARQKEFVEELPARTEEGWYTAVIGKAELADYSPVRGCMVIRPYGFALWEKMQASLDARFKATGHRNAYFPIFVPESLLLREAEHVEGFSPQVAWVTEAGGEKLEERLAIRPTSEAIIGTMYGKWVQSWRDLPILVNQWCNVVRWEKRTIPFLRTTEFLWQEGHTAHRTTEEAQEETMRMLEVYRDFVETDLAIPVVSGRKSESEKFPGADATYAIEGLMPDGRALQCGTSHNLGQNFARAFDISFQDMDGERRYAWTTSWGLSTRTVGAVIMVHGDDGGLILPPRVAPIQVVILPIWGRKDADRAAIRDATVRLQRELAAANYRVEVDSSEEKQIGWKHNEWTLRGVPIRLELGPRDVAQEQVVLVRRDDPNPGRPEKRSVGWGQIAQDLGETLDAIQANLFDRAARLRDAQTRSADSLEAFAAVVDSSRGFIWAHWCGSDACEATIKDRTGATIRCLPLEPKGKRGACIVDGRRSESRALFARAY